MGMFAAVVNEFANGNITHRPWGAILSTQALLEVLQIGLVNVAYLTMRSYKGGRRPKADLPCLLVPYSMRTRHFASSERDRAYR